MIEISVFEGTLQWDGRVLELFRNDGKQGAFRVLGAHVIGASIERRKDRLFARFDITDRYYVSVEAALEQETALAALVAGFGRG